VKKLAVLCAFAVLLATSAVAADMVAQMNTSPMAPTPAPRGTDATVELKIDNGTCWAGFAWYTGTGWWVGNDFSLTTLTGYNVVESIGMYEYPNWPNGTWEGFRLGVFNFSGGAPGSILWGPTYVKPTASGWGYYACGYTVSGTAFLAGMEQYYNHPACDNWCIDSNATFLNHTWTSSNNGASWAYYGGYPGYPYKNLMLRAVVATADAVAPSSVGRIKALYY
jgi:hypothetical protein